MFKFLKAITKQYSEIEQLNPLRWEILFKNADGVFEPQTAKFKCKDFFNDIVAKYNGHNLTIYGMDTSSIKLNEEGVYVRLKNLFRDNPYFIENLQRIVIDPVKQELGAEIWFKKVNTTVGLLFLPREVFKNTYIISLVTYLIRCCNNKLEVS